MSVVIGKQTSKRFTTNLYERNRNILGERILNIKTQSQDGEEEICLNAVGKSFRKERIQKQSKR